MLGQRLYVLMNFLGLGGAILIIALLCAATFGKWEKGIVFRCMLWFSVAGIAIPIMLLSTKMGLSEFALTIWPSSLGLLGLDGTGSTVSELSVIAMLVLINAGLYGIVGLIVGYSWQGILRFHKEGK